MPHRRSIALLILTAFGLQAGCGDRTLFRSAAQPSPTPRSASPRETNGDSPVPRIEKMTPPAVNGDGPEDALLLFYSAFPPNGRDTQVDAALLFSYYLQNREGKATLGVGDLIRCCIRAGVDTRNFNRVLGTLMRRGFLEAVHGHAYQLSEQGVAAVESRM